MSKLAYEFVPAKLPALLKIDKLLKEL